jgi:endogenous inhibitor of DNA gyrase (YacG/DUF329 family)
VRLSTQSRFVLTVIFCIVVGLFIGVLLMATQLNFLAFVFFGWVIVMSFLMYRVKCPNCDMPVVYQGKVMGISFYAGICKSKCANCGHDLSKVESN